MDCKQDAACQTVTWVMAGCLSVAMISAVGIMILAAWKLYKES